MALDLPATAKEISQKAKIDVRRELADSNPFLARSWMGSMISSLGNRVFEFYAALREASRESNPFTTIINLPRWAAIWSITRLQGSVAAGDMFIDSTSTGSGKKVKVNERFVSGDGDVYIAQMQVILGPSTVANSSLTRSFTTATFTASSAHGLASNALVTITGATPIGYNVVDAAITVISATVFTFTVVDTLSTPAGGTPVANINGAVIEIRAEDSGKAKNLSADAALNFETPINNVETFGQATFGGIVGGGDVEADDALRARYIDKIQNPNTPFNVSEIQAQARTIPGVTRVFVQEKTPAIGQVTVHFMRDNDVDPIPNAAAVTETKNQILTIKPAHIADSDVVVSAPTAVETDFVFSAISPATQTMKDAVEAQLQDYFDNTPEVGTDVLKAAYDAAIFTTVDPTTGDRIISFTLSAPTTTITISGGEIGTLGTVTFP